MKPMPIIGEYLKEYYIFFQIFTQLLAEKKNKNIF